MLQVNFIKWWTPGNSLRGILQWMDARRLPPILQIQIRQHHKVHHAPKQYEINILLVAR